jgi:hypothetical protein
VLAVVVSFLVVFLYCVCSLFVCNLCYLSVVLLCYFHRVKAQLQFNKYIYIKLISDLPENYRIVMFYHGILVWVLLV